MAMSDEVKQQIIDRITAIGDYYEELQNKLRLGMFGGLVTADDYAEFNGMCLSLIDRATGRHDAIYEQALREIERFDLSSSALSASLNGLVGALRRDIAAGSLQTIREAERADLFADMLRLAESLLTGNRIDAAAVLLGSVLVTHLCALGVKRGMPVPELDKADEEVQAALQALNTDLVGEAYGKLAQSGVADGLKLWHDATQGAAGAYNAPKVSLFLDWLRGFIAKYPA